MPTFFLRKLVASLLYPPTLSLLVALFGFYLVVRGRFVRTGKALIGLGLFALLLLSIPAIQQPVLRSFETPPATSFPDNASAIVVLGGGTHTWKSPAPATSQLSDTSLARAIEGIRLAREYPSTPLIFTGGRIGKSPSSSEAMAKLAQSLGIPENQIVTFDTPTSTEEEAKRTAEELGGGKILLVTSALHLPRAQALFIREGFEVTPAPTDFLADDSLPGFLDFLPSAGTWLNWQKLFHEIYGRLWAGLPVR